MKGNPYEVIILSDTTVTVSDEDAGGDSPAEEATIDSVREQGKAEGAAAVHADAASSEAMQASFHASDAQQAADVAAQAAEATATAALATTLEGAEIRNELAQLRESIQLLAATMQAPPVDADGDGVPDPVPANEVDPSTDQEPTSKGNWLNRTWGRKKG